MQRVLLLVAATTLVSFASTAATNIIDLQPNTGTVSLSIGTPEKPGSVRLTSLNTGFNIWYVLSVHWPGLKRSYSFHLENPAPERYTYTLDSSYPDGLLVREGNAQHQCELWRQGLTVLSKASKSKKSFVPLCDDRILVRNTTEGRETTTEFVVDFLRNHVWGGEQITGLVKDYIYKDRYLISSTTHESKPAPEPHESSTQPGDQPTPAAVDQRYQRTTMDAEDLGIELDSADSSRMNVGRWFVAKASPNIFVSAIEPRFIDRAILTTQSARVKQLDAIEKKATVYLAAFKLSTFDLGFELGTLHPSAEWSYRAPNHLKTSSKPGPDGIKSFDPLVMVGKVNPFDAPRVSAVFAGGFKRTHGAFKWGRLSEINQASHYGFRVNGVDFSTLQPNLATLLVHRDGQVQMKTWTEQDRHALADVLHARQNGVPIIEWDPKSKQGIPGEFVGDWGRGNWSGSAQREQRTLRAATCLQQTATDSYLIFGYFSSVTPNSIARVFQAYQCRYAMHLDMNGLEHTYLAVYLKRENDFSIQYLVKGMNVLDREEKGTGTLVPRFLGTADNRDFFYVMAKE